MLARTKLEKIKEQAIKDKSDCGSCSSIFNSCLNSGNQKKDSQLFHM